LENDKANVLNKIIKRRKLINYETHLPVQQNRIKRWAVDNKKWNKQTKIVCK